MPRFRLPVVAVLSSLVLVAASGCGRSMERVVMDAENAPSHGAVTLGTLREHAPEPFLASDAHKAAELFNATGRRSRSLAECQIAAVAMRCGARMNTANASDFTPFQTHGLTLA